MSNNILYKGGGMSLDADGNLELQGMTKEELETFVSHEWWQYADEDTGLIPDDTLHALLVNGWDSTEYWESRHQPQLLEGRIIFVLAIVLLLLLAIGLLLMGVALRG